MSDTVPGVNPLMATALGSIPGMGFGSTGQAPIAQQQNPMAQAPAQSQVNPNTQMFAQAGQAPNQQQMMQLLQQWQNMQQQQQQQPQAMNGGPGMSPAGPASMLSGNPQQVQQIPGMMGTQGGATMGNPSALFPPSQYPPQGTIGDAQGSMSGPFMAGVPSHIPNSNGVTPMPIPTYGGGIGDARFPLNRRMY